MSQNIYSATDRVRQYVRKHQWKDALRIVRTFKIGLTDEQRAIFGRAWESYHYGYMMAQLKRDPDECRRRGIALLQELYGAETVA